MTLSTINTPQSFVKGRHNKICAHPQLTLLSRSLSAIREENLLHGEETLIEQRRLLRTAECQSHYNILSIYSSLYLYSLLCYRYQNIQSDSIFIVYRSNHGNFIASHIDLQK